MKNRLQLARCIDHTVLKPEAGEREIRAVTAEALEYGFAAVCVNSCWVELVRNVLDASGGKTGQPSPVAACSVVGFPFGAQRSSVKAFEAETCVKHGADEIDMVIWIPALLSGNLDVDDIGILIETENEPRTISEDARRYSSTDSWIIYCQSICKTAADLTAPYRRATRLGKCRIGDIFSL